MAVQKFLYQREIPINDNIHIVIPTVGEVDDHEEEYFSLVNMLTAMPIDMMVQLDDIGVDFTTINEYDLFTMLFRTIQSSDTSLIFGDLDLSNFTAAINQQNNNLIFVDSKTGIRIDRALHGQIAAALRKIHFIEKDRRKPANGEAQKFMLERARTKLKRRQKRTEASQLEGLIVSLVNTSEFPYNFETVRDISIYQFNASLRQVIHKIDYDNRMHGIYAGTLSADKLSQDDLTWITHK